MPTIRVSGTVQLQQAPQLGNVKTHDNVSINLGHRARHIAKPFQFSERPFIGCDVSIHKFDVVLRKELFHFSAKHSAGLAINDNLLVHRKPPRANYSLGELQSVRLR